LGLGLGIFGFFGFLFGARYLWVFWLVVLWFSFFGSLGLGLSPDPNPNQHASNDRKSIYVKKGVLALITS